MHAMVLNAGNMVVSLNPMQLQCTPLFMTHAEVCSWCKAREAREAFGQAEDWPPEHCNRRWRTRKGRKSQRLAPPTTSKSPGLLRRRVIAATATQGVAGGARSVRRASTTTFAATTTLATATVSTTCHDALLFWEITLPPGNSPRVSHLPRSLGWRLKTGTRK